MQIRILGAAAGGGFPQWNCNCPNCAAVRAGKPGYRARTQNAIAVSANSRDWVLFNVSPDLRQQINASADLQPAAGDPLRHSPIKAVVVTGGDVDFLSGLIHLREQQPFSVYASDRVLATLKENTMFNVLDQKFVPRRQLALDAATPLEGPAGPTGLTIESFDVPGKVALYLENEVGGPGFGTHRGDNIAFRIADSAAGQAFYYIPSCARVDERLAARLKGAKLVVFDGTLYTDDEMIRMGLMPKTCTRMGHMYMSGPGGSVEAFKNLDVARKIYVHINNSNPVLNDSSEERRAVEAAGWEVGFDGMEVRL
jgi:pyrroloquinoline quinone biosynthesis protein B